MKWHKKQHSIRVGTACQIKKEGKDQGSIQSRPKTIFQEVQFYKEIIYGDPSIYITGNRDLVVYSRMEHSIGLKGLHVMSSILISLHDFFGVGITLFAFVLFFSFLLINHLRVS